MSIYWNFVTDNKTTSLSGKIIIVMVDNTNTYGVVMLQDPDNDCKEYLRRTLVQFHWENKKMAAWAATRRVQGQEYLGQRRPKSI